MAAKRAESPVDRAAEYKAFVDAWAGNLEEMAQGLPGKEHHKDRVEKGKEIAELHSEHCYIDACRVLHGLPSLHGHFADAADVAAAPSAALDAEEAARLAAAAEQSLQDLEPARAMEDFGLGADGWPENVDALLEAWRAQLLRLETKVAQRPARTDENITELQCVAGQLVDYRARLKRTFGYRNKDLKTDPDLGELERRLDSLADVILAAPPQVPQAGASAEELRRHVAGRVPWRPLVETAGLCPSEVRELERLQTEIADLKAQLRAQGLTEHESDREQRVLLRLLRLRELSLKVHHDKKHSKAKRQEIIAGEEALEQLHGELRALKQELRAEGWRQREVKENQDVCELEERLAVLQKFRGA